MLHDKSWLSGTGDQTKLQTNELQISVAFWMYRLLDQAIPQPQDSRSADWARGARGVGHHERRKAEAAACLTWVGTRRHLGSLRDGVWSWYALVLVRIGISVGIGIKWWSLVIYA